MFLVVVRMFPVFYAMQVKYGVHIRHQIFKKFISSFVNRFLMSGKILQINLAYYELGRFPLIVTRKLRILKYWLKLKHTDACILQNCFQNMMDRKDTWIVNIKPAPWISWVCLIFGKSIMLIALLLMLSKIDTMIFINSKWCHDVHEYI